MIESLFQNKKILILVIGVGFILLLAPFYFAEAFSIADWCNCRGVSAWWIGCWLKCLGFALLSLPIRIFFAIIVGIVGIGALIAGFFYVITVALVNWLMRIILEVGIVPGNPATPDIVEIGWTFTRDFANMFFILALVFIGLATVLRIKEYEAKKALSTLIIIALLINFTPVIVGFVVDMGNLVTNFFLEQIGSISTLGDIMGDTWTYLITSLQTIFVIDGEFFDPVRFPEIMAEFIYITVYGSALLTFFLLAIFIYILIGAVFFFRTVILWILMILAPIAFLSKVFPNTRTTKMIFPDILHWDKWWEKLIQWTIIGIPISFFLYLSSLIMFYKVDIEDKFRVLELEQSLRDAHGYAGTGLATIEASFIDLLSSLLAPTIALVLLAMGAMISFKVAPEGAQGIMRFTHEKGVRRAWTGIRKGVKAAPKIIRETPGIIRSIPGIYKIQRGAGATRREAFKNTIYGIWQRRKSPSSSTTTSTTPTAPTADTTAAPTAPTIIRAEETGGEREGLTGEERLERRQRLARGEELAGAAPAPPSGKHRARIKRTAKIAGKVLAKVPARMGWRAATGILSAAERMATQKIDKELGAKKGKEQKTCSDTTCRKDIDADARFCDQCGQAQP